MRGVDHEEINKAASTEMMRKKVLRNPTVLRRCFPEPVSQGMSTQLSDTSKGCRTASNSIYNSNVLQQPITYLSAYQDNPTNTHKHSTSSNTQKCASHHTWGPTAA